MNVCVHARTVQKKAWERRDLEKGEEAEARKKDDDTKAKKKGWLDGRKGMQEEAGRATRGGQRKEGKLEQCIMTLIYMSYIWYIYVYIWKCHITLTTLHANKLIFNVENMLWAQKRKQKSNTGNFKLLGEKLKKPMF